MFRFALFPALIVMAAGPLLAQETDSSVADTIAARRGLMTQLMSLQSLVDSRVASGEYSPELYDLGQAAAASLDAFAMLLPPESNLLGGAPAIEGIETTATDAIWSDLPAFRGLLREAAANARSASEAGDLAEFQAEWEKVANSCESCHEAYVFFDPFGSF